MKLAIMQPYLFPYISYFQLIQEVDIYVLTGDLQYMKDGWINRNRILVDGKSTRFDYFTFPVVEDAYWKPINQRKYCNYDRSCNKLMKRLKSVYGKAINYNEGADVIRTILNIDENNVANVNIHSIREIAKYLEIDTPILATDELQNSVREKFISYDRLNRLYYMCKYYEADTFLNAIGGMCLYFGQDFERQGIKLGFIKSNDYKYEQGRNFFVKDLSIIDVIMNNKKSDIKRLMNEYKIIYSNFTH